MTLYLSLNLHARCLLQMSPGAVLVILLGQLTEENKEKQTKRQKPSRVVECKSSPHIFAARLIAELERRKARHRLSRRLPLTWSGFSVRHVTDGRLSAAAFNLKENRTMKPVKTVPLMGVLQPLAASSWNFCFGQVYVAFALTPDLFRETSVQGKG